MPKARAAVDRALQIDDSLAEAHASSGLAYQFDWQWPKAEQEYKRAITLNPNYPTAHHWFCVYFYVTGHLDEAEERSDGRRNSILFRKSSAPILRSFFCSGTMPMPRLHNVRRSSSSIRTISPDTTG